MSTNPDLQGFPGGTVVKNPPANAGDAGDTGSTPGSERPLEEEMATHSSILAWKIPWTEEPGGLQAMGSKTVRQNLVTNTFTFTIMSTLVLDLGYQGFLKKWSNLELGQETYKMSLEHFIVSKS